ncbi:MAG TPA: hypothetical protein VN642_05565 [Dongiaceae bacterium]|nr:hypothetical protein [Dongiaceae bacterium]
MSTEAEVAMLMLRLLVDKPKELQKVMDYLRDEVMLRKANLEAGKIEVATREEIMSEFEDKYGLVIKFSDDESDKEAKAGRPDKMSGKVIELPTGAMYKVG